VHSILDRQDETLQAVAVAVARRADEVVQGFRLAHARASLSWSAFSNPQGPRLLRERAFDLLEGNRRSEQDERVERAISPIDEARERPAHAPVREGHRPVHGSGLARGADLQADVHSALGRGELGAAARDRLERIRPLRKRRRVGDVAIGVCERRAELDRLYVEIQHRASSGRRRSHEPRPL
jgi:hypothetical protein